MVKLTIKEVNGEYTFQYENSVAPNNEGREFTTIMALITGVVEDDPLECD